MDLNVLHNPFIDLIGARLVEWEPESCVWELDISAHHTNTQGSLHGGVIATLLDVACGYSGFCPDNGNLEYRAATLSLTVNYLSKAIDGKLLAKGVLVGGGRRVFFSEAQLICGKKIIATASGTFRRHHLLADEGMASAG